MSATPPGESTPGTTPTGATPGGAIAPGATPPWAGDGPRREDGGSAVESVDGAAAADSPSTPPLVRVEGLRVGFGAGGRGRRAGARGDESSSRGRGAAVVDGVSFEVRAGRAVAIVGESGSGKSVTARALVGLVGAGSWVTADVLEVGGESVLGVAPQKGSAQGGGKQGRGAQGDGAQERGAQGDGAQERGAQGDGAQERGAQGDGGQSGGGRGGGGREMSAAGWRRIRGGRIGLVVQDALVSLDPLRPIGREIGDALRLHTRLSAPERRQRVLELLESVGMPEPAARMRQRSGELSGGLRQRALIASALAGDPELLIADEPTTALDSTVQAQILSLFESIKARGTGLLFISHDLAVVSRIADEVLVMREGRVVESGPTAAVLGDPQHEYTKALLRAVPTGVPRGVSLVTRPTDGPRGAAGAESGRKSGSGGGVLEAVGVGKRFEARVAVEDASFVIEAGRTLGLVGESGSGKTTLARVVLGLTAPDAGTVRLDGEPWAPGRERDRRARRPLLGAVYQDALSSFDPRLTVRQILADALGGAPRPSPTASAPRPSDADGGPSGSGRGDDVVTKGHLSEGGGSHYGIADGGPSGGRRGDRGVDGGGSGGGRGDGRVEALLREVGLGADVAGARPLQLSGGQRQRVSIARALAPQPRVIVLDEPVSALDVSIQAQILDLLDRLQRERGVAYLFISHDLGVVQHMSDDLAVMKDGRIVEQGPAARVFADPAHPYTRELLAAAPRLHLPHRD
ncbi:dipeptide ABC transporter ATP-binding protein [Herbiconiux liukaitaii]|uniref:dipeptide ABC transporter ATP-binding protein n=1 Tax=Herbiconiux liukaitaii TaxID=3342799 RepID=UPI0035BB62F9